MTSKTSTMRFETSGKIMNDKFALNEDLILRKEWFGCLVCNTANREFYQFNEDAFTILKEMQSPLGIEDLRAGLKTGNVDIASGDLAHFLEAMMGVGIVVNNEQAHGALVFYADKEDLRKDCLAAPTSVTLYITEFCPKTCKHCVTEASPNAKCSREYGVEQWRVILEKLRAFGVCSLVFTGGDPLTKKGIFEIMKIADNLKFAITLLTDYDGINKEHIDELKSLRHLADVQVSLDGSNEESHDTIRGKGSFQKALKRMRLLQTNKMKYTISTTINNRNISEIDDIVSIYKEYGASSLYLNPLAPYGRAKELMKDWLLSEEQLRWLGKKYLKLLADEKIQVGNPFWKENVAKTDDENFHPFEGSLTAVSIGIYNFSIGSRGECHLDSKMKSEGILNLGNALEDDLEAMWYDSRLDHLRSFYAKDRFTYVDQSTIEHQQKCLA
ncbi:radical SAM protein [Elusimicrobiota bacterium]